MSYSFTVEAKDNVLTIAGQTTEVPDGKYVVNGHEDATGVTFGAYIADEQGVSQVSVGTHYPKAAG